MPFEPENGRAATSAASALRQPVVLQRGKTRICLSRRLGLASSATSVGQRDTYMTAPEPQPKASTANGTSRNRFWQLTLGSTGIVFGDIGTSPLYAMRESLNHVADGGVTRSEVIGVVSLLLWALVIVVALKYVTFLMRADNGGEGGVMSLMALCQGVVGHGVGLVFVLGIIGGALFFGDALITPAISVLAAVEGLNLVTPVFEPYVMWIAIAILVALFAVQNHGTGRMSDFFGPIASSSSSPWPASASATSPTTSRSSKRSTPGTGCASSSTMASSDR